MTIALIVYILTLGTAFGLGIVHYTHMYQLESYVTRRIKIWIKANLTKDIVPSALPALVSLIGIALCPAVPVLYSCSAFNLLSALLLRPKKAKKPIVFTARVKRLIFTSELIFWITVYIGIHFGLLFLMPLILALCAFTVFAALFINEPAEAAMRNKFINEAKQIIRARKNNLIVIGITGSYGKTSTKFYLEKLLSKKYNVLMTPGNYNTTLGVVRVVREMLKPSHEIFICEMGARNTGEIKEICDIVLPSHGIITSVGPQHLDTFKTIENVAKTKFELAEAVSDDGVVVLNGDYDIVTAMNKRDNYQYFGVDNKSAQYRATDISCSANGTEFTLKYPGGDIKLSTRLLGKHTVLNIVSACAVALSLGVDVNDIKTAVRMLESVPHRLEIIDGGNVVIIDDSYNSNPSGSASAVETLSHFDGLKVLVTPGMVELGEKQYELNKALGEKAARVCDYIYIVGKHNKESIAEGVISEGFDENKLVFVSLPEEAVNAVRALSYDGQKYVLLENDLPDNFN